MFTLTLILLAAWSRAPLLKSSRLGWNAEVSPAARAFPAMQPPSLWVKGGRYMWSFCLLLLTPAVGYADQASAVSAASGCAEKEEFIETHHEVMVGGQPLSYRAVAGTLLLKDDQDVPKASIFYVSYTKAGVKDPSKRPVTFCFNGGPGSSSVWLHLGLFGPRRVCLDEEGHALLPYRLVDNEYSLLDETDLVFIDPVSTGFSRAIPADSAAQFHSVAEDIKSIAAFIRLFLTRFNRWESPKFIAGESYGTTRAAGLAEHLHHRDYIYVDGIILISTVLNFQSVDFNSGNDLPYLLFLPSYTATAWYHRQLDPDLQENFLATLQAAREFVINDYARALFKGHLLTPTEKEHLVAQLVRFTGLSPEYVRRSGLRLDIMRFAKELLRRQAKTVGRFDSRFTGVEAYAVGEYLESDPSAQALFGAFTATLNHYLRTDLKWVGAQPYQILTCLRPWDYGSPNQYLNMTDALHSVMLKNPHVRVFVGNGYYDLATPFFATEYTFHHLGLEPSLNDRVIMRYYDAGHMMYIYRPALIKLKQDLAEFYQNALPSASSG